MADLLMTDLPLLLGWIEEVSRIEEWQVRDAPEVYGRFVPYWAGWALLALHYAGLGLIGLAVALRGCRKKDWSPTWAYTKLAFFAIVLPYPLAFLNAYCVPVNSACNLIPYVAIAPFWALYGTGPAALILLLVHIYRERRKRAKKTS